MTSQFKSFLSFAANAAVVVLVVGFIIPGVYRAVKKVPSLSAAGITQVVSIETQTVSNIPIVVLTFDDALNLPPGTCDVDGAGPAQQAANTCYGLPRGVFSYDNGMQARVGYVARGPEWAAAVGAGNFTNAQAVVLFTDFQDDPITPNPAEDTVTITLTNFTGAAGIAGRRYAVGCNPGGAACTSQPGNGVNNLELVDCDTEGFGLTGEDFCLNWVPKQNPPAGLTEMRFYVLRPNIVVNAGNIRVNACGGGAAACNDVGFTNQYNMAGWDLPPIFQADSDGQAWDPNEAYKACVWIDATADTLDCSPNVRLTADIFADTEPPFIDHIPVHRVVDGVPAVMHAFIFDEQTAPAEFSDGAGEEADGFARMNHGVGLATAVHASPLPFADDLYVFSTVDNMALINGFIGYYLAAGDSDNNTTAFGVKPNLTLNNVALNPINAMIVAPGIRTVSGTVTDLQGNPVEGAYVFLGGLGVTGDDTDVQGAYGIANVPFGGYDVMVAKNGYCDANSPEERFINVGAANVTKNLKLNFGECFNFGDEGGGPEVVFTSPHDLPSGEPIRIGYNQPLNASTVNDFDMSDPGSRITLSCGGLPPLAAEASYCPNNTAPGCSALFSQDQNVILVTPAAPLSGGHCLLTVSGAVTSSKGQPAPYTFDFVVHDQLDLGEGGTNFGSTGEFMPLFVDSMLPPPGFPAPVNTNFQLHFSEAPDQSTITEANIQLVSMPGGAPVDVTITVDSDDTQNVVIDPEGIPAAGYYELRVNGAVANANGIPMILNAGATDYGFVAPVKFGPDTDNGLPTAYPDIDDQENNVPVNIGLIRVGFSEPMDPSTISCSDVTFTRGSTAVSKTCEFRGELLIAPSTVLAPNTAYTVTLSGMSDLAKNDLANTTFTFWTDAAPDTVKPRLNGAQFDDFAGIIRFNEPMNSQSGGAASVINHANLTLSVNGGPDVIDANVILAYDAIEHAVRVEGLSLTPNIGNDFELTVSTNVRDLSDNALRGTEGDNVFKGKIKDPGETFGHFGEDGGMFGPGPTAGEQFKPGDFGKFGADDFIFGGGVFCHPFVNIAGMDSNVFQCNIPVSELGGAVQDGDGLVLTFPSGTGVGNCAADTFSPFFGDMNQFQSGTITFDNTFDGDGVRCHTGRQKVTVQLDVTGNPTANDVLTLDLRGIINPSTPKEFNTGGYTVSIDHKRAGSVIGDADSAPYFITPAGTNNITLKIYAGAAPGGAEGASGTVSLFGGGPSGPLDGEVELTNGITTAYRDSTILADAGIQFANLPDGCYGFGIQPFVNLNGNEFFALTNHEPVCVFGGQTVSKNLLYTSAAGGASIPVNVSIAKAGGFDAGTQIDVFGGGPSRFAVKTITVGDPGFPANASPLSTTLPLTQDGEWFVGVGPAMPKGNTMGKPNFDAFGGIPPAPISLKVRNLGAENAEIRAGSFIPQGAAFNDQTDTATFTIRVANIPVPVSVTDGTTGIANAEVFVHCGPGGTFGTTDANGDVTLLLSDTGLCEGGAHVPGFGMRFINFEIKPDGLDPGIDADLYFNGAQVLAIPIKVKKPGNLTLSGKVLDSSGSAIAYAPVWAVSEDSEFIPGQAGADGSFSFFVAANTTYTLNSELPPDRTDLCGSFTLEVAIVNESKANQNLSPTNATCYTLQGDVTVDAQLQADMPVFIESWNTVTDRPSPGFHRGVQTNSDGHYTAKVPNGTYRVGFWNAGVGQISETVTVDGADKTLNLDSGALNTITFDFVGGAPEMIGGVQLVGVADRHTNDSEPIVGTDTDLTVDMPAGNYNYVLELPGIGTFTGTVTAGEIEQIDLSDVTLVDVSGTVYDDEGDPLPNAVIEFQDANGIIQTVEADVNGDYSTTLAAGTWDMDVNLDGYVAPTEPVTFTGDVAAFDVGGETPDVPAVTEADATIEGTVLDSANNPPAEGTVWASATDADGNPIVISAPIDPVDGSYTLEVTPDTAWTVTAVAPLSDATDAAAAVNTVSDPTVENVDITLTAEPDNVPASSSTTVDMTTTDVIADETTGITMTLPGGTLGTSEGTAQIDMEMTYTAPETNVFTPLDNVSYDIVVTDAESDQLIKDFAGNVEFEFEYDPTLLPTGVEEGDLEAVYFDTNTDEYVPCEGGSYVDGTNNTVTCVVAHATSFSIVYPTPSTQTPTTTTGGGSASRYLTSGTTTGGTETVDRVNTAANTTTSVLSNTVRTTLQNGGTLIQPLQVENRLIETNAADNAKTFKLTSDGVALVLKPSQSATVSVTFPENTAITATSAWTGDIQPPVVQPKTVVQEDSDYEVQGDRVTLKRTQVESVIKAGSASSALTFSNPVIVGIPVNLASGAVVKVYTSEDGLLWEQVGEDYVVNDNQVQFTTTHMSYFAVVSTGETRAVVREEEAEEILKEVAEEGEELPRVAIPFVDTQSHWSKEFVSKLYGLKVLAGKSADRFAPDDTITRAELAKIALLAFGYTVPERATETPFKDVPLWAWYAPYIQMAKAQGIIQGYSNGYFKPEAPVNRAEALKILLTAAKVALDQPTDVDFYDVSKNAWYYSYIAFAKAKGIVQGYANLMFRPGVNITRGEAAKMVVKILEMP